MWRQRKYKHRFIRRSNSILQRNSRCIKRCHSSIFQHSRCFQRRYHRFRWCGRRASKKWNSLLRRTAVGYRQRLQPNVRKLKQCNGYSTGRCFTCTCLWNSLYVESTGCKNVSVACRRRSSMERQSYRDHSENQSWRKMEWRHTGYCKRCSSYLSCTCRLQFFYRRWNEELHCRCCCTGWQYRSLQTDNRWLRRSS